jgi:cytochrome c2
MRSLPLCLMVSCLISALAAACTDKKSTVLPVPTVAAPEPSSSASLAAPAMGALESGLLAPGDAEHGKALMKEYECNRCHDGTGLTAAEPSKHCVKCHSDIVSGKFNAPAASLAKWKPVVAPLVEVPSLTSIGARFTRAWVESYLAEPFDLRARLVQQMPRLALSRQDVRDVAAHLVPNGGEAPVSSVGNADAGRTLLDSKGCGSCHAFTGVSPLAGSAIPVAIDQKAMMRGQVLAPDLRYTRDRFSPAKLLAWLRDPKKVKPDTSMPSIPLTGGEVADIAMYLQSAELQPLPAPARFVRLPVLDRKVLFAEVDAKVLHKVCWHCHAEPDFSIGDGGPGNSGGLGFKPRGLNLASYEGVQAGLFAKGTKERGSLFAKSKDGTPHLVRSLVARHSEVAGNPQDDVRGMPLGMPPLPAEDIQLVETWIAQGRPK